MSSEIDLTRTAATIRAQAASSIENIWLTLVSNVIIAVSLSFLLYFEDGEQMIFAWLATAVALASFRALWATRMKSQGLPDQDPGKVLRALTALAFASGILWSVVPLGIDAASSAQKIDYIAFIVAGTTTGAIIQSLAYSPIAIAFAAPLLLSTIGRLVILGTNSAYIIAADAALLALMLFRAAKRSEQRFVASQVKATEAIDLANSLGHSNRSLERLARTDPLTGLANRSHFQDVSQAACRSGKGIALVLFDIDNFKTINDSRGHSTGDGVIRALAHLLRSTCGKDALPVRLGGDEFVVILEGSEVARRSVMLADRLSTAMRLPMNVGGQALSISCSIGIAAQEDGEVDIEDLFARADVALYRAKDDGRACTRIFDTEMQSEFDLQRCIDLELPVAIEAGQLHVEFQPQVKFASGEVIGFEALVRWKHPKIGMVPPPDIVNAAIRLRISGRLTRFVAEQSCAFICALDSRSFPPIKIAINVSPREFSIDSPARILKDLCSRHDLDPKRIEIEITEEAMFDPKHCAHELSLIDQYGFGLAIDDFGVGHSSISNLMAVEIDAVKIDRSFVRGIRDNVKHQQLVSAINAVALPLGHRIVAEGVETSEDEETLRLLGCLYGQGWLYGRAMVADEAIEWFSARLDQGSGARAARRSR